ncbi:DNA primase, partial [Mesotoga sp. B105.6.4]
MENLVNYAKTYAAHGFSVIPIVNKRPLVKFANRPALTKEEIDAIWTKHPTASIALQTREFLVIDVDRHEGGDGMESIKSLGHNEWFKSTLCEKTHSGGFNFY